MDRRKLRNLIGEKSSPGSARRINQRGQSMVLVALLMFVFIALLAVIFDGGYAFLQRRNAQTAADAGALAGARELCLTGDPAMATQSAFNYAITRNRALEADVVIVGGEVEVTTRIPFATFFSSLLGRSSITSSAIAAANCFSPASGEGVLPVAWHCSPGAILPDGNGGEYCDMQIYDDEGDPELYIIMNSRKTDEEDTYCASEGGAIDCDPDGDGYDELLVGGNRSWLDFTGSGSDHGNGSSELVYWIENGFPNTVNTHTWYAGQPGVSNNVFMSVDSILGYEVLLPVYNAIVDGSPPQGWDGATDAVVWSNGNSTTYYHVISFSVFVPTCVRATGADKDCEMYNQFSDLGVLDPNDKTIEGYFVNGSAEGLGGQGELDAGAFTLYLTR